MELTKCNACGWLGPWDKLESHFFGKNEIPICPACWSAELEDVDIDETDETDESEIPF